MQMTQSSYWGLHYFNTKMQKKTLSARLCFCPILKAYSAVLAKPLSRNRGEGKENEVKRKHCWRSRQDKGHRQRKLEETVIP